MVIKATGEVVLEGKKIKFKEGALHRQLKIPEDQDIGVSNLRKIKKFERKRQKVVENVKKSSRTSKTSKSLRKHKKIFGNVRKSSETLESLREVRKSSKT